MNAHLLLNLQGPMMAFGAVAIEGTRPVQPFPAQSAITGLLGCALGYERRDHQKLQALQDGLVFGTRIEGAQTLLRDFQTVQLSPDDTAFTTCGTPQYRASPSIKLGPHLKDVHYWVNVKRVTIALRSENVDLEILANALQRPMSPLFIGRKSCIPSKPIFAGIVNAKNIGDAIATVALILPMAKIQIPVGEGTLDQLHIQKKLGEELEWANRIHGGMRSVQEGLMLSKEGGTA